LNDRVVVLFGKYAGNAVKVRDQELLVIREDDIVARIHLDGHLAVKPPRCTR